jgi:hypothetical protein
MPGEVHELDMTLIVEPVLEPRARMLSGHHALQTG